MNLQGDLKSNFNTDGRTDGLRTNLRNFVNLKAVDAGAHTAEGFVSPGDVIAAGELWPTGERHPVLRTGERATIPVHVRAAVWYRDNGQCSDCSPTCPSGDILHLDHIVPWSAGGTDATDNLRLLCERHNLERSNYVDFARPKRPATWWCVRCYDRVGFAWEYVNGLPLCPTHRPETHCRVTRRYLQVLHEAGELPTWHERGPITNASVVAYCAHCNLPGLTDQPL